MGCGSLVPSLIFFLSYTLSQSATHWSLNLYSRSDSYFTCAMSTTKSTHVSHPNRLTITEHRQPQSHRYELVKAKSRIEPLWSDVKSNVFEIASQSGVLYEAQSEAIFEAAHRLSHIIDEFISDAGALDGSDGKLVSGAGDTDGSQWLYGPGAERLRKSHFAFKTDLGEIKAKMDYGSCESEVETKSKITKLLSLGDDLLIKATLVRSGDGDGTDKDGEVQIQCYDGEA